MNHIVEGTGFVTASFDRIKILSNLASITLNIKFGDDINKEKQIRYLRSHLKFFVTQCQAE